MREEAFLRLVRRTGAAHTLRLIFKMGDTEGLLMLYEICMTFPAVRVPERDMIELLFVAPARKWPAAYVGAVSVQGLATVNDVLIRSLGAHVDRLEFPVDHMLKGLRERLRTKRDAIVEKVLSGVITTRFLEELGRRGYRITGAAATLDGMNCIEFHVQGKSRSVTARVDGWSGMMALEDRFVHEPLYDPEELQDLILSAVDSP